MIQLAYVSSTRGLLTAAGIAELLVDSRERNHARQITGMLLYKGGNVLQVIEGDEPQILALFRSIVKDPRHTGVIKLYQKSIRLRDFPDWTMGFHNLDAEHVRHLEGFSEILDENFDMHAIKPSSAAILLSIFKGGVR